MQALVFNGPRDVRYERFDDPKLGSVNSAIIQVRKCSICGSDLHIYHGEHIGNMDYSSGVEKFCVGHEFMGEVVETGPEVHGFAPGDKVLAAGGSGCGKCALCLSGKWIACPAVTAFGVSAGLQGGQAELVNVPNADATLMRVPEGLTDEQAILLTDAAATAYFGITNADVKPGGTVAVVGLGPIGLIGIELARILGAARIFALDPVAERRTRATALGAEAHAPGEAAFAQIRDATQGAGVQSVFEASGAKSAVETAIALVRAGGTLSCIGLPQPDVTLPLMLLLYKNITVRAGVAPVPLLWEPLVALFQHGQLKAPDLFTHHMALRKGADAYQLFDSRKDGVIKIMMTVD